MRFAGCFKKAQTTPTEELLQKRCCLHQFGCSKRTSWLQAAGSQDARSMSVTDLTEQLASTEQLVTQLKELVREKDAELRTKDLQLKVPCVLSCQTV